MLAKLTAVFVVLAVIVVFSATLLPGIAKAEQSKLLESLKQEMYLMKAEHAEFHNLLDALKVKYPGDKLLTEMGGAWHDLMHKRIKSEELRIEEVIESVGAGG